MLGGVILTTLMATNPGNNGVKDYVQQPPIVKNIYVQKLQNPTNGNTMILRIQYYEDANMAESIALFNNGNVIHTLKDDGTYPDVVKGDFIYSTYVGYNVNQFLDQVQTREERLISDGGVSVFEGHIGRFIPASEMIPFDVTGFNNFQSVQMYQPILDVAMCEGLLLKQNSLLITDLSVVEDPARTYNVFLNYGNPNGCWTFGTLIRNMANEPATAISPKEFLKRWVKTWTEDQIFSAPDNSFGATLTVSKREDVFRHLIFPWIEKAHAISNPNVGSLGTSLTPFTWESHWDNQDDDILLANAPFKLMAIVNRLDLRGNFSYFGSGGGTGETRFVYTLIDPLTGKPPFHSNIASINSMPGAIDWVGMNLILEYGNPNMNMCQLKNFAQQWYDLSAFPLGTYTVNNGGNSTPTITTNPSFNDNLQEITDQITTAGQGGGKPNGSAINQIRTNEKLFEPVLGSFGTSPWTNVDWELRQFQLDELGWLVQAPVSNTIHDNRGAASYTMNQSVNFSAASATGNNNTNNNLLNWIYGTNGNSINKVRTSLGNHNFPDAFLDASARIYGEFNHSFGIDWVNAGGYTPKPSNYNITQSAPDALAKKIQFQVTLNTCQGCHGGANKTNFTQIYPRGYGEAADYWSAIPSYVDYDISSPGNDPLIDNRLDAFNQGTTLELTDQSDKNNSDDNEKFSNQKNQVVSPFLTGRKLSSVNPSTGQHDGGTWWQDDELDDATEATDGLDITQEGFYYVNDPNNESNAGGVNSSTGLGGKFPQIHTKRWGFNDLERRKSLLCGLTQLPCVNGTLIELLGSIVYLPLPTNSH